MAARVKSQAWGATHFMRWGGGGIETGCVIGGEVCVRLRWDERAWVGQAHQARKNDGQGCGAVNVAEVKNPAATVGRGSEDGRVCGN